MRAARSQSSADETGSDARRQKETRCATPCSRRAREAESRPAERRFRRVGCGRAIDGQSEQNTARLRQADFAQKRLPCFG